MSHALFGLRPPEKRAHRQSRLDASLAEGGAEACLRRDHCRRRARSRHGLLPRQAARHHQCRRAGEELSRLRQYRAQHHHHSLELSAARQHRLLRALDEAVGGAEPRAQLQHHGEPARHPQRLPFGPAAERLCAARQRHAPRRRRCRAADARPGARLSALRRFRQCAVPYSWRADAAARRHGAPRRRGLGLCPRRR